MLNKSAPRQWETYTMLVPGLQHVLISVKFLYLEQVILALERQVHNMCNKNKCWDIHK